MEAEKQITYFSLGLFHNPLTESISGRHPFYKMHKKTEAGGKNKIAILKYGYLEDPAYVDFTESFDMNIR